jgi:hypothetical protein
MSDSDMSFSEDGSTASSFYYRYGLGTRAETPPRPDPVTSYNVKYVEGSPTNGKTM